MNVKSEEIINFANKVCRMCFWDYLPSKVCDASIVKMVSQDVDQSFLFFSTQNIQDG